jgi:hypothetical protein
MDAYDGRNPRTGKIVEVKPKKLPFFKGGRELKKGNRGIDNFLELAICQMLKILLIISGNHHLVICLL